MDRAYDHQVRLAAFEWVAEQVSVHGDVLPRNLLAEGFFFRGERVPLVSPQGIFKPRILDLPLSITTVLGGPYDDAFRKDGFLSYRYRGTDPKHHDNTGLRRAMQWKVPLVYFHGIVKGEYLAAWPVYVVGDEPGRLTFTVAVEDSSMEVKLSDPYEDALVEDSAAVARRIYVTASVRRRIHQSSFRARVLQAYRERCALCRLRQRELLDAAHIVPDVEPEGEPLVQNGLALCKLHHAAFDRHLLGITPDCVVEVRKDVLEEIDGPMLIHGLQGIHRTLILLPRRSELRPDRDLLAHRYERFKRAG